MQACASRERFTGLYAQPCSEAQYWPQNRGYFDRMRVQYIEWHLSPHSKQYYLKRRSETPRTQSCRETLRKLEPLRILYGISIAILGGYLSHQDEVTSFAPKKLVSLELIFKLN